MVKTFFPKLDERKPRRQDTQHKSLPEVVGTSSLLSPSQPTFCCQGPTHAWCHWGHFEAMPHNHCLCFLSEKCAPNQSNWPGATKVLFGSCTSPKILLVPPKHKYTFILGRKHEWTLWQNLRFCDKDLFSVFIPESVGMNWDSHHRIPLWPPSPGKDCAPMQKLCPKGRKPARSPAVQIGIKTFCLPNLRVKLFYTSKTLFVPSSPPGYATLAPHQAVRLINLACPSQEEKKTYLKTSHISIEKHVKTACWQLSTYVSIKSHKNTVLIRVKQGCQNSNLNHLCWTDEIFRINKYEGKITFKIFLGVPQWGVPLKRGTLNSNFLIVQARHITISG